MRNAAFYLMRKDRPVDMKENFSNLELLGAKQFLVTEFKKKGEMAYFYSTYTTHSKAYLSIQTVIGTKNQITVRDQNSDVHMVDGFQVSTNGILYAITDAGRQVKIELEALTSY